MTKTELYTVESWMALLGSDSCPKLRDGSKCFLKGKFCFAFELQIKRQILEKMLGLEEHIQGQKCEKDKLLLIETK